MSAKAYMIADLHLGHKKILSFEGENRSGGMLLSVDEHDHWIICRINRAVGKRDSLYLLGDVAFGRKHLKKLEGIICKDIHFILGNHDTERMAEYEKYGRVHTGLLKYKGAWLSHAPVHPDSLRGLRNVHGHIHSGHVMRGIWPFRRKDDRYSCVSVEHCGGIPVAFDQI